MRTFAPLRIAALTVVALCALLALPGSALAVKPTKMEFSYSEVTSVLTGVCAFDINVVSTVNGTQTDFVNESGVLTRRQFHVVEQDTFTANGKTLEGLPFTFNVEVLFDSSGNETHNYASGLVERIVLPNGDLFLSAGRIDFATHPVPGFVLTPDMGVSGDLAGFCAALAP
jgi:hypothetical protein